MSLPLKWKKIPATLWHTVETEKSSWESVQLTLQVDFAYFVYFRRNCYTHTQNTKCTHSSHLGVDVQKHRMLANNLKIFSNELFIFLVNDAQITIINTLKRYIMKYKSQKYVHVKKNPLPALNIYYRYFHHYSLDNWIKQSQMWQIHIKKIHRQGTNAFWGDFANGV